MTFLDKSNYALLFTGNRFHSTFFDGNLVLLTSPLIPPRYNPQSHSEQPPRLPDLGLCIENWVACFNVPYGGMQNCCALHWDHLQSTFLVSKKYHCAFSYIHSFLWNSRQGATYIVFRIGRTGRWVHARAFSHTWIFRLRDWMASAVISARWHDTVSLKVSLCTNIMCPAMLQHLKDGCTLSNRVRYVTLS